VSWFPSFHWNTDPIGNDMDELVRRARAAGIPVKVTSTRRSVEEQRALYAQGRTEPGAIVTWTLNSKHVDGRAFDLTIEGAPEFEDDPEGWELLGELGQDLDLDWGGTFGDFGHFELPD
jgi:peptidoglycan L-alanyl-D-glutamate endopeptidase CwlK